MAMADDPFFMILIALGVLAAAPLVGLLVEGLWAQATYLAYLWRHRNRLRF